MRQALFALAEKTGHADPDDLGRSIPAALLIEWTCFWKLQADASKGGSK